MPGGEPTSGLFLPLFVGAAFLLLLLVTADYLMRAVYDERGNRTMEVLMTSVSPGQLLGGKVLGIVAITLTLLAAWVATTLLFVIVGGDILQVEWLRSAPSGWPAVSSGWAC